MAPHGDTRASPKAWRMQCTNRGLQANNITHTHQKTKKNKKIIRRINIIRRTQIKPQRKTTITITRRGNIIRITIIIRKTKTHTQHNDHINNMETNSNNHNNKDEIRRRTISIRKIGIIRRTTNNKNNTQQTHKHNKKKNKQKKTKTNKQ